MADHSRIEWTEATWNPIAGCSLVSPGCTNCYAMRDAHRLAGNPNPRIAAKYAGTTKIVARGGEAKGRVGKKRNTPVWTGRVNLADDQVLTQPLRWTKPRAIFVNSMSDLFHPDVPDEAIDRIFAVMALSPQHTFQVLTKRPERMRDYLISRSQMLCGNVGGGAVEIMLEHTSTTSVDVKTTYPAQVSTVRDSVIERLHGGLPNVWLGVSCEDQTRAEERVPILLDTPAAIRWVSAEPLIGPIDFTRLRITPDHHTIIDGLRGYALETGGRTKLDWIVAGGESGAGARPMHPDWVRSIRDQCASAGVAFHFKQWGQFWPEEIGPHDPRSIEHPPGHVIYHNVGKKRAGRRLAGVTHNGFPARAA